MAVPAGPTEQRYTGNGVSTVFAVPFLVIQASDLAVYVDGVRLTSGYTQTGVGNPTSSVTFGTAPALNASILFTLEVPFERLNDYQENGDFLSFTVNRDFDRIWQALKQLLRFSGRALTLGQFDVDGQGWYRAKGNGIRDLRDPVQQQDAATLGWVNTFVSSLLSAIQGPINNAANIFYRYPNNNAHVVQDLSSPTGTSGIGRGAGSLEDALAPLDGVPARVTAVESTVDAMNAVEVIANYNGTDETAALQAAINKALAAGKKYVLINGPLNAPGTLTGRGNVFFSGKGTVTGAGVYRRAVYPDQSPTLWFPGIDPARHLIQFSKAAAPVVVLMGDSLGTLNPNSISQGTLLKSMLEHKVKLDNPGKAITFHTRAIGGQHWTSANSKPAVVDQVNYSWYTDPDRAWLEYVKDLTPDLLIFAFGMNDQANFQYAQLKAVLAKVNAWPKVPSIIFCTNLVPTMEAHPDNFVGYSDRAGQEGRDFVAGYTRCYAERNGYGLIDINRVCNIVRDGFDTRRTFARFIETRDTSGTGYYQATVNCRDFSITARINGDAATQLAKYGNASPMALQLSSTSANAVFIGKTGANNINLTFYEASGSIVQTLDTGVPVPSGDHFLYLEVKDNTFTLQLITTAGVMAGANIRVENIMRFGGEFVPRFNYFSTLTGPSDSVSLNIGDHILSKPLRTDVEMWGTPASSLSTKSPYGGNGLNHPTSIGAAAVYGPAIDAADFRMISPSAIADLMPGGTMVVAANDIAAGNAGVPIGGKYRLATGEVRCRFS